MKNIRLTLKDLNHDQHKRLNAAVTEECKKHGVKFAFELSDAAKQAVTRRTLDTFAQENAAAALAAERARTASLVVTEKDVKSFTWGAKRRR